MSFDRTSNGRMGCVIQTIQTPVTGNEPQNDLSRPEQVLAQFYGAFNRCDLDLMKQNWLQ